MEKFSSYGPINTKIHYYVPRESIITKAYHQLIGESESEQGHYITIWAPRQSGKTWIMQQVMVHLLKNDFYETAMIDMQLANNITTDQGMLSYFITSLKEEIGRDLPAINEWEYLYQIFETKYFPRPLILIIDEFDALQENFINKFATVFRAMHMHRIKKSAIENAEQHCMLHGLSLIGIRSVLGIENVSGSPFNVQRSVRIPNFTEKEVRYLLQSYETDSGQSIEPKVIEKTYDEFNGQPGLTSWFAELLTEQHNKTPDKEISTEDFNRVYSLALNALPNNNIINIISKARAVPYKNQILELFKTDEKIKFNFNNPRLSYLYMLGVIGFDIFEDSIYYVKFHCPYVQKSLFNYFSEDLFQTMGPLMEPFAPIDKIFMPQHIDIKALIRMYESYLNKNKEWILKDAPRRADLRIYEAVYHFNLYMYLTRVIQSRGNVLPEFPTGNGKIDLIIKYNQSIYALELKSFSTLAHYHEAIDQAHDYACQLELSEITLVFFIESISDEY